MAPRACYNDCGSLAALRQHFGWKVGVTAYAVAAYVGASRIHGGRHYLSDVAFGAVAGRTISVSRRHRMALALVPSNGGAAIALQK